jgi:hypothetical protein
MGCRLDPVAGAQLIGGTPLLSGARSIGGQHATPERALGDRPMTVEGLNLIRCNTCGATAAMPAAALHSDVPQPVEEDVRNWAGRQGWTTDNKGDDGCPDHSDA